MSVWRHLVVLYVTGVVRGNNFDRLFLSLFCFDIFWLRNELPEYLVRIYSGLGNNILPMHTDRTRRAVLRVLNSSGMHGNGRICPV